MRSHVEGRHGGLQPSLACRAETRSQGIATFPTAGGIARRGIPLAEPRPVLRGLRLGREGRPAEGLEDACRAETRSQGIATSAACGASSAPASRRLQSRDPFSGDCDSPSGRGGGRSGRPRLAEPRPVLRGLRQQSLSVPTHQPISRPCRAETRSQGIATLKGISQDRLRACSTCRAETRSQGIATTCIGTFG